MHRFSTSLFRMTVLLAVMMGIGCVSKDTGQHDILSEVSITLSKKVLQDKIKGGWAGQTIGVVYGVPNTMAH